MKSINLEGVVGNFEAAKHAAWEIARTEIGPEAALWSWHDTETGEHSPPVECCGDDCHPAWVIYAESRGATLEVTADGGRYEFYFGPAFT